MDLTSIVLVSVFMGLPIFAIVQEIVMTRIIRGRNVKEQ